MLLRTNSDPMILKHTSTMEDQESFKSNLHVVRNYSCV